MPPKQAAKKSGSRASVIDLTTPATTAVQGVSLETLCNGPEISDEDSKEVASRLMGMLVKQPWVLDAMQEEMSAQVGRNAMSHYNDKRDYFLELWLESEDTQDELLNWAKEQFVKSGQADAAREQAKREVKQQVEEEIKASSHKMAGLEREARERDQVRSSQTG
jgi:hypothetical protein